MKVLILGCKHMHVHSYIRNLSKIDDVEVIGIVEDDRGAGLAISKEYGIEYFEKLQDALSRPSDAVLICSENSKHHDYAVAAAMQHKHVIVEKPMALTMEDCRHMIATCAENGVKLMVALPVRYAPPIRRAKQLIENGKLGSIVAIAGTNHGSMPGGWFVEPKLSGGGAVIDHTIHVADLMHWMLGADIKDVYCKLGTKIHEIEVEDCGLISMEFENGTYATLDTSWNRPKAYPTWGDVTMEIIGTKGTLNVDAFAQHGMLYSNKQDHSSFVDWGNDMDELMIQDFVTCIREDLPSPVTGEDGMFAVKIALMAYKSASINDVVASL